MKIKNLSLKNLAILISDHLRKSGIEVVLSGGACVSIYTQNKYISCDLDFVLASVGDLKKAGIVLKGLGFYEQDRYFKHEDTMYFIDFVSPPLSVGAEPVRRVAEIKKGNRILRLLSVTDCVKDRLAAFYHWNDRQSLQQAILVCHENAVDLKEVKRWSKNEGMEEQYQIFTTKLKENF